MSQGQFGGVKFEMRQACLDAFDSYEARYGINATAPPSAPGRSVRLLRGMIARFIDVCLAEFGMRSDKLATQCHFQCMQDERSFLIRVLSFGVY